MIGRLSPLSEFSVPLLRNTQYRLYFHPVVLGRGKPFFAGPRPPLRLVASDLIVEDMIRLRYVPA
jgi:hypothetical protein